MKWPFAKEQKKEDDDAYVKVSPELYDAIDSIRNTSAPQYAILGAACVAAFGLGWRASSLRRAWRRLHTMMDVTSQHIGKDAPLLRGKVISVSDGDTFRLLHVPSLLHSSSLDDDVKLSDSTLQIRVCTIDTPETAKFGKEGQPFGQDAKEHLTNMLQDKTVQVQILAKDQYGRGVAEVLAPGPLFGYPTRFADQEMLKAGLAEVYQGSGAVYGRKGKEAYLQLQERAQQKKEGMWSLQNRESAAEYKARIKSEG